MPLGAAGAAALIQGGTSLLGGIFGQSSQSRQNKANMKLAKYQHDLNMDAWRQQNEYNTPLAQMQRYRDAGINPHMVAGSGGAGNAQSPPQYQAPTQEYRDHFPADMLSSVVGDYIQQRNQKIQGDLLKEQIKSSEADTALKELEVATASNEYEERFGADNIKNMYVDVTDEKGENVIGKKLVGQSKRLSKYQQEYNKRQQEERLRKILIESNNTKLRDQGNAYEEKWSEKAIKQREREAELKLKKLGHDVKFGGLRNWLASMGLTFSTNEYAPLLDKVINYIESKYYEKKKKKK